MNLRTRVEALEKLKPAPAPDKKDPDFERQICQHFFGRDSYDELTDEELYELETAVREAQENKA